MVDIIKDTLIDALKILPFLYITYLIMEYIERHSEEKSRAAIRKAGAFGPLIGGLLGIIPQCGFSAAAANLYAGRVISLGTLYAVFLSTSDEMLPILISERAALPTILRILAIKAVLGIVFGYLTDIVMRLTLPARRKIHGSVRGSGDFEPDTDSDDPLRIDSLCEQSHCGCEDEESGSIFLSALKHTMQIMIYLIVIMFVLNLAFSLLGQDRIQSWFSGRAVLSIFIAGLIGLIPNCGASVALTELYLRGVMPAGAMIAGLLVGAGVGLLVLFRVNRNPRQNILITAGLYILGVLGGLIVTAIA